MDKSFYRNSTWGLRVVDVQSGEVLLDHNPEHKFFIGSVRKIFSVGLLLNELGPDKTYDTPVYRTGSVDDSGVVDGSLVLVASGDLTMGGRTLADGTLDVTDFDHNEANTLGTAELSKPDPLQGYKALARQVAAAGVTRVTGDVVVDDRLFQPFDFRGEFQVRPIFVNDDVVDVSLSPTTAGEPAQVGYRPHSAALSVKNKVLTTKPGSELDLEVEPEYPKNLGTPGATSTVQGSLPEDVEPPFHGTLPLIRTVRITQPSNFARTVFIEALESAGVQVDAPAVAENPVQLLPERESYRPSDRLALLKGSPLGEVTRFILKVSYNIGADTSLMLLGLTQGVDELSAALAEESELLSDQYGLQPEDFHFVDGSGGGETQSRNRAVTTVIRELFTSPGGQSFYRALPIMAVDGSLSTVTDFQSNPSLTGATGKVRAKTGTYVTLEPNNQLVAKGQAFGGFIEAKSGRLLAYQLVVNEVPIESVESLNQIFQDEGIISAILWRDY